MKRNCLVIQAGSFAALGFDLGKQRAANVPDSPLFYIVIIYVKAAAREVNIFNMVFNIN